MNESTTCTDWSVILPPQALWRRLESKCVTLELFEPIHQGVHIAQKTVKHRKTDKLYSESNCTVSLIVQ
jgi:hypothetical protein